MKKRTWQQTRKDELKGQEPGVSSLLMSPVFDRETKTTLKFFLNAREAKGIQVILPFCVISVPPSDRTDQAHEMMTSCLLPRDWPTV